MALGATVATASILGYRRTTKRTADWRDGVLAGVVPVAATITVVPLVTPTITATGAMPTGLVTAFRGLTVLTQAAIWAVVASSFTWLHDRVGTAGESTAFDDDLTTP